MPRTSLFPRLAPPAVVLVILAAAGNWYLQPEKAWLWMVPMLAMPVLWGAAALLLRSQRHRFTTDTARREAAGQIRSGITFASLLLLVSLVSTLLESGGLIADPDVSRRSSQIVAGLVLVWLGNAMPKMLTPLSAQQCDGSKTQAFQRLSGWTWVLAGLTYVATWIVLPIDLAGPVSMAAVVLAMVIVGGQLIRLKWFSSRTTPPTGA